MSKIIIIGCPGSGKSRLTFRLLEKLKYPVLHLDKIYHIDNNNHISREEFTSKVHEFAVSYNDWIIDGNHISTIEQRIKLCDTVVLLDLDTDTCVQNVISRSKKERTADMAEGFDISKISEGFIEYISKFKTDTLPKMLELLNQYKNERKIIILNSYKEIDDFVENINLNI